MKQEVIIKGNANEDLTRLIEVAIKNQLEILEKDIRASKVRLSAFEKKLGYLQKNLKPCWQAGS
ncbi:MAG TPA: hypothetical protein PKI33_12210 [Anaerolineales bacterium]|nr:hypothetical protein [Anaerolineales bacterium]